MTSMTIAVVEEGDEHFLLVAQTQFRLIWYFTCVVPKVYRCYYENHLYSQNSLKV